MTPHELRDLYYELNPDGHFFDEDTLSFFGDTMENYIVDELDNCYELSRMRPVKNGLHSSHYFHKETMRSKTTPY